MKKTSTVLMLVLMVVMAMIFGGVCALTNVGAVTRTDMTEKASRLDEIAEPIKTETEAEAFPDDVIIAKAAEEDVEVELETRNEARTETETEVIVETKLGTEATAKNEFEAEVEEIVVEPKPQTFVLIDLSEQTLWVLKSTEVTDDLEVCEILLTTGIVSGTANTSRATPTGTYEVYSKVPGKYLRPSDGGKVWVDYWMPFNGSIGLHDATWRDISQFGTDQYLKSGSHGCINMPHDMAAEVYNLVEVGTVVYVVD